jgi:hypothetical protein
VYKATRFLDGLFVLCVAWGCVGYVAAWLGVFYAPAVLAAALALTLLLAWRGWIPDLTGAARRLDRRALAAVLVVCLAASLLAVVFAHDTFFSARDEGLYSNGAVYLSQHARFYPFHQGFDVRTSVYTTWLAGFYGLGGVTAMRLSILPTFFFGLLGVYLLYAEGRRRPWLGVALTACLGFCYTSAWFPRRTLSENAAFMLLWPGLALAARGFRDPTFFRRSLWLTTATLGLGALTRIEDLVPFCLFYAACFYLALRDGRRGRRGPYRFSLARLSVFILVGLVVVAVCFSLYLGLYSNKLTGLNLVNRGSKASPDAIRNHYPEYVTMVFWQFGYLLPMLAIPFYLLVLLLDRARRMIGLVLLPLLLVNLYFFYRPNIIPDLPWVLRRFSVFLIPLAFLAFFSLLSYLRRAWLAWIPAAAVLALTLAVASPVLFYSEYPGVREAAAPVIEEVPDGALLLVDRYALVDYFLLNLARVSLGKQAVTLRPPGQIYDKQQVEGADPYSASYVSSYPSVYMLTSRESFEKYYGGKVRFILDDAGQPVEVTWETVAEADVRLDYLKKEAELHRGEHSIDWPRLPHQVYMDAIRIPSTRLEEDRHLMLLELELEPVPAAGEGGP